MHTGLVPLKISGPFFRSSSRSEYGSPDKSKVKSGFNASSLISFRGCVSEGVSSVSESMVIT